MSVICQLFVEPQQEFGGPLVNGFILDAEDDFPEGFDSNKLVIVNVELNGG